jgi:hypothetical protein
MKNPINELLELDLALLLEGCGDLKRPVRESCSEARVSAGLADLLTGCFADWRGTAEGLARDCRGTAEGLPRDCRGTAEGLPRDWRGTGEGLARDCRGTGEGLPKLLWIRFFLSATVHKPVLPPGSAACNAATGNAIVFPLQRLLSSSP